jgi:hypothetical protein
MFDSEPYRDDNWFGFWSTSSVFGLVGDYPGPGVIQSGSTPQ